MIQQKSLQIYAVVMAICLLLPLLAVLQASAEGLVVFESSRMVLAPGQVVDRARPFFLRPGQRLFLIAENGRLIKLFGPFWGAPGPRMVNKKGGVDAFESVIAPSHAKAATPGVPKSVTAVYWANQWGWVPDPEVINVERSGHKCLFEDHPVIFWRRENGRESPLNVKLGEGWWEAKAQWPKGASRLATPKEMPIMDGVFYRVMLEGTETALILHIIPATVKTAEAKVTWMHAVGCQAQATALLRQQP